MSAEEMIPLQDFCIHHHIEQSFVYALQDSGLVEIIETEEQVCVPSHQLAQLERMVNFYTDMDINIPGIEAINHLLQKMEDMQQQIVQLHNRLRLYENE